MEGIIGTNENSWPPPQRPAWALLNARTATYAAVVGHILTPPGIFTDFNPHRAVITTDTALDAAAAICRHLIQAITWRGINKYIWFSLK